MWPWLVQNGDCRAGWYSYDWIENWVFPGTVHRADGRCSAMYVHPEFQDLQVGDRIDTGGVGKIRIGAPRRSGVVRKMMLGIKQRAETSLRSAGASGSSPGEAA